MENLTLDNYAANRDLTRELSEHVQARLGDYLGLLQPQLRPGPIFGSYAGGKENPKTAATSFAQFKAFFNEMAAAAKIEPLLAETIDVTCPKPVLTPFVYPHTIASPAGEKRVTVTVPIRFALAYPDFPVAGLQEQIAARVSKAKLQQIALYFALLNFIVMHNKPLLQMFDDLGFPLSTERPAELAGVPLTMVSCPAGSVCPPDNVIAQICRISGANVVEEVADADAWSNLNGQWGDWYRERRRSHIAAA
jgi:hypothetical protein